MTEPARTARIRSFVRREGRITPAQRRALETQLGRYGLPEADTPLDQRAVYGREAPLTVEIGCGNGDVLLALATARPDCDFLGIEVYRPGLGHLLHGVHEQGLTNLRVASGDARDVIERRLGPGQVSEFLVFFPDPWPKKRHHKRRLLSGDFLTLLAGRLQRDGRVFVATDWADYAEHIDEALAATPALIVLERGVRPGWRPVSRFEQRAIDAGRAVSEWCLGRADGA